MNDRTKNTLLLTGAGLGALVLTQSVARRFSRISLEGKTVIITGGSRGLGLEMGRQLAGQGARLAICARDPQELERGRAELVQLGAEVFAFPCDITERAQVDEFVSLTARRFGGVDALINNAGIIQVGPTEVMTPRDFEDAMRINFWSALYMTLAVLPDMRQRGEGRIVNISSFGGRISVPHLLPYSASKFALTGLSEGLRHALGKDGIKVTTVLPGPMRTGSHVNIDVKGKHEDEYAWFSFGASTPVLSLSAKRAAREIISAMREGRAQLALPLKVSLAIKLHALFPETSDWLLGLMERALPALPQDGRGTELRKGYESRGKETTIARTYGASITEQNNEM